MENEAAVVQIIRRMMPDVYAVYLFGSRATNQATRGSDVDLAVLQAGPIEPVLRWRAAEELASVLGHTVDLVDLRAASAVMRAQVLSTGRIIHDSDPRSRALFEALALSDYARLNEERRWIIDDVRARGTIYG